MDVQEVGEGGQRTHPDDGDDVSTRPAEDSADDDDDDDDDDDGEHGEEEDGEEEHGEEEDGEAGAPPRAYGEPVAHVSAEQETAEVDMQAMLELDGPELDAFEDEDLDDEDGDEDDDLDDGDDGDDPEEDEDDLEWDEPASREPPERD
jgi:hypothetical protein